MVIDHIGVVVKSMEKAIAKWKTLFGYDQMTEPVENTRQKVEVVFLQKKQSITIKLIRPIDNTSPVYQFARKGGGIHHFCFKCDNLDKEAERLNKERLRIITKPEPGEAFENEKIAFLFGNQGLHIELIDTDKKANKIL